MPPGAPATALAEEGAGGRLARTGVADPWSGQIGNPAMAQAPLTNVDQVLLRNEMFSPGGNSDLG